MAIKLNGGENPTEVKFVKDGITTDLTEVWYKTSPAADAVKVWPAEAPKKYGNLIVNYWPTQIRGTSIQLDPSWGNPIRILSYNNPQSRLFTSANIPAELPFRLKISPITDETKARFNAYDLVDPDGTISKHDFSGGSLWAWLDQEGTYTLNSYWNNSLPSWFKFKTALGDEGEPHFYCGFLLNNKEKYKTWKSGTISDANPNGSFYGVWQEELQYKYDEYAERYFYRGFRIDKKPTNGDLYSSKIEVYCTNNGQTFVYQQNPNVKLTKDIEIWPVPEVEGSDPYYWTITGGTSDVVSEISCLERSKKISRLDVIRYTQETHPDAPYFRIEITQED